MGKKGQWKEDVLDGVLAVNTGLCGLYGASKYVWYFLILCGFGMLAIALKNYKRENKAPHVYLE
jgi:hypothetical protein